MKKKLFFAVYSLFFLTIDSAIANNPNLQPKAIPVVSNNQAITATNSAWIKKNAVINGAVAVNEQSFEEPLVSGFELAIDTDTNINGPAAADSVELEKNAAVTGDLYCNELTVGTGTTPTSCDNPVNEFPVIDPLPPFKFVQHGVEMAPDHLTGSGEEDFSGLPAGVYRDIILGANNTICLGGEYDIRNLTVGKDSTVIFTNETEIRVAGAVIVGVNSKLVPEDATYDCDNDPNDSISASDIRFYVAGENISTGGSIAGSAFFGGVQGGSNVALLNANVYALNGNLEIGKDQNAFGCFIGVNVLVNQSADVTADCSFLFGNQPPVAEPKTVFTNGDEPLVIELNATDPDGDELSFSIVNGVSECELTEGTLGPVTEITESGDRGVIVLGVTVTYTPDSEGNLPDCFTFQAEDPEGAFGQAQVLINPPEDPNDPNQNPPPVDTVVAFDKEAATSKDTTITIKLTADAPCDPTGAEDPDLPCDGIGDDVPLTFSIVQGEGPTNGSLNNLTQGDEVPQRSATVDYTPAIGFISPPNDSFDFKACGIIGGTEICDIGTVNINVFESQAVANPQQVTTPNTKPDGEPIEVLITLSGIPGFSGTETRTLSARAAFLEPAEIAGSVSDTNGDGNGDASDNLPGPAPEFMAAAIGPNSGSASFQTFGNANDFDAALSGVTKLVEDFENRQINDDLKGLEIISGVVADTNMANLEVFSCSGDKAMFGTSRSGFPTASAAYELTLTDDYNAVSFVIDSWDPATPGPVKVEITFRDQSIETIELTNPNNSESDPVFFGVISDGQFIDKIVVTEGPETGGSGNEEVCLDEITVADTGTAIVGLKRIQMEWDITSLEDFADSLVSADVILHTEKSASDSLDTFFFVGTANQDGQLTNSDFQAPAAPINGVVMSVPDVPDGTTGTFSFDVLSLLHAALRDDSITHFSIQGRVDEDPAGYGQGLQVRTTATGNVNSFLTPQLSITTPPPVAPPLTFYITSLPLSGTLLDGATPITSSPTMLLGSTVSYVPDPAFTGLASFGFMVDDGNTTDTALVTVVVESGFGFGGDCEEDKVFCLQGR